jgi:hypothetical protein
MAFEPTLPSAADWIRDPVGSWGRLWQAFNYKLDAYNAGLKQLPLLQGKLAGYELAIARISDPQARANLTASLQRFRTALGDLVASRGSLEGKVLQGISDLRAAAATIGQHPASPTVGQPIVWAAVAAGAAVVMYGITQWLIQKDIVVAQERSIGNQVLSYAAAHNFTPAQTQALMSEAAKVPAPQKTMDLFQQISQAVPWLVGLAALIYFGPTIAGALSSRRRAA